MMNEIIKKRIIELKTKKIALEDDVKYFEKQIFGVVNTSDLFTYRKKIKQTQEAIEYCDKSLLINQDILKNIYV